MEQIDAAIADAEKKYDTPTTTKKETTTKNNSGGTTAPTATATKNNQNEGKYISLTYPVPSQTRITCGFHGYTGHSGADFSCPTGSKVVAAESGTVIISADLYDDNGNYRSYGRYIVIKHDKTTSSGAAVYTLYAHNSERLVSAGQHVEKGSKSQNPEAPAIPPARIAILRCALRAHRIRIAKIPQIICPDKS